MNGMKASETFHEAVTATMTANGWTYAYACGYCHGKDDRHAARKREVPTWANDAFALGYHAGYHSTEPDAIGAAP